MNINEIFLSIQGEGLNMGLPTIFVRTAGCNLRCSYCDTKYAYDNGKNLDINDIADRVAKLHIKRVC
ncbi:MAG: radical SAM protein, partial [Nanoarchaeota archaeon]|nr:radical SAM protein [Nanoarchaeota archaeon]